jgi:hypothetical protein
MANLTRTIKRNIVKNDIGNNRIGMRWYHIQLRKYKDILRKCNK